MFLLSLDVHAQAQAEILYEERQDQLQDQFVCAWSFRILRAWSFRILRAWSFGILRAWRFRTALYLLSNLRGCGGGRHLGESL